MNKFFLKLIIAMFVLVLSFAIGEASLAAGSGDAIAVRVYQNPKHFSALEWYKDKGFTGSPQAIMVDGYEGVMDGRTAYVNVGNISGTNLYTNIYVISYTGQAEAATADIFTKILSHWKFNNNIKAPGSCKITLNNCKEQANCPADTTCTNNKCVLNTAVNCLIDDQCPADYFCDSFKSSVTRDTRRLADKALLKKFMAAYGYPKLEAGTYKVNNSISVWPSWQEVLGQGLKNSLPTDPINSLAGCTTNLNTCWDETNKVFEGIKPGSFVYSYVYQPSSPATTQVRFSTFESDRFSVTEPIFP